MTKQELLAEIDKIIDPENMSPDEQLEFLEDLADEITKRIQGIEDDMQDVR